MSFVGDLDRSLLRFNGTESFSVRDAFEGVHIFGGIGSGKTSSSGKTFASAYLRAGWGGVVLCAKPDEVALWKKYARDNGRASSLVIFDETQCCNFLNYEMARQGKDGVAGVVQSLMQLVRMEKSSRGADKSGDPFWEDASTMLLTYTVMALYSAYGEVTVPEIMQFIASLPKSPEDFMPGTERGEAFLTTSHMAFAMGKMHSDPAVPLSANDQERCKQFFRYLWLMQFEERVKGSVVITVSAVLNRLMTGRLSSMFCGRTTLLPDMTFHGAIIVLAMPVLSWNEDGEMGQKLFKSLWQRAVLARNGLDRPHAERPVFLWCDEAQFFVTPEDAMFVSAARSSRAATVFMTQSLPNYYARMGGDKGYAAAQSLIGLFKTKVFHNNACMTTNNYSAELCGKELQWMESYNESEGTQDSMSHGSSENSGVSYAAKGGSSTRGSQWQWGGGRNTNRTRGSSVSQQERHVVRPEAFMRQRTGGPRFGLIADAYVHRAGAPMASGHNFAQVSFRQ